MPENNQDTLAMDMLKELKATNKRKDIIILVILALWFATIAGYIWYNSLPVEETTTEFSDIAQDSESGGNIIAGGNVNGEANN